MSSETSLPLVADQHPVVGRLARGEPVLALGVRAMRTPEIARMAKASGHHMIWVDLEHSAMCVKRLAALAAATAPRPA